MTSHDNERLKRLEKRLNWLRTRIYQGGDADLSYDKAEASALEWAIDIVEKHLKVKQEDCRHIWSVIQKGEQTEFFCTKCLEIRYRDT